MAIINGDDLNNDLNGTVGDDTIDGRAGDDTVIGSPGADALIGGAGIDTVDYSNGGSGVGVGGPSEQYGLYLYLHTGFTYVRSSSGVTLKDTLAGFENATGSIYWDTIIGTAGPNTLIGGAGVDEIFGGAGNDIIYGADEPGYTFRDVRNRLFGEDGDDTLYGSSYVFPGQSFYQNDLFGGAGDDTLYGGIGDDTIQGDHGEDDLFGEGGNDLLYVDGQDIIVSGGAGNDFLVVADNGGGAWSASDIENWFGASGNDFFSATTAATLVYMQGYDGDDVLAGGEAGDYLYGGAGNDVVAGAGGGDTIQGLLGADRLFGDAGDDFVYFDSQDTAVEGNAGFDWAVANDFVSGVTLSLTDGEFEGAVGSEFADTLTAAGATWTVEMRGGRRDDTITGGDATSILLGEAGNDILISGPGVDHFVGGVGGIDPNNDTFWMVDNGGTDYIYDWEDGADKINMSNVTGVTSFGDLVIDNTYAGDNWYGVNYGTGVVWVQTGGVGAIDASDFVF